MFRPRSIQFGDKKLPHQLLPSLASPGYGATLPSALDPRTVPLRSDSFFLINLVRKRLSSTHAPIAYTYLVFTAAFFIVVIIKSFCRLPWFFVDDFPGNTFLFPVSHFPPSSRHKYTSVCVATILPGHASSKWAKSVHYSVLRARESIISASEV